MSKRKFGLDIGHDYLSYPPSKGVGNFAEWSFNNAVVKKAVEKLKQYDVEVYLSQPIGKIKDVGLNQRVRNINRENLDFLISIHANWNDDRRCEGHWVFYCKEAIDSLRLAQMWHNQAIMNMSNRSYGKGITGCELHEWTDFAMTMRTNCTSILIEHDFYSNKDGLARLQTDKFQTECAETIVKTVCEYYNLDYIEIEPKTEGNVPSSWAVDDIKLAKELEISDCTRLKENCTREEQIVMIMRMYKTIKKEINGGN